MRANKIVFALASVALLSSCNNNMKGITDDQAKTLASEIASREATRNVPNKFIISATSTSKEDSKLDDGSTVKVEEVSTKETIFDLDNLKRKTTITNKTTSGEKTTNEQYDFLENNIFYTLNNTNGDKTREETPSTKEAAILNFTHFITEDFIEGEEEEDNKTHKDVILYLDYFKNFETTLAQYKAWHDGLKDEKDQYCNYSFGSNNNKSFQERVESKMKIEIPSVSTSTITISSNMRLENDLMTYYYVSSKIESNSIENPSLYNVIEIKCSYNNANITLPNINDYKVL